jgi:hypothetical protein
MSTLKRIDPISVPAVENSLAIFDILPTSVAFNRTHIRELLPLMTVTRDGPYTFRLYSDTQFVDFRHTWLYLVSSLEKYVATTNSWVPISDTNDDKNTGVIQNYGSSFIKQLNIIINGIEVFNSDVTYAWRAYIANEFGLSYDFKKGLYESCMYYADDPTKGQEAYNNEGFKKRVERFRDGIKAHTLTRLNFDLANQNNLFLNNSDVIFKISRNSDNFLILAPDYTTAAGERKTNASRYRINVHDIRLYCTVVDVVQSLQNQISKHLISTPAKYPLRKIETRTFYITEGQTNVTFNAFSSIIPRRVLVFLVNNSAFDGHLEKSPFLFTNGKIQSISVEANNLIVPSNPYHFDFVNSSDVNFIRAFVDFYEGLDLLEQEREIQLTLEKFKNGWCGWVFPLTASYRDVGDSFELIKNGTTVIKARFTEAVQAPGLMLIALGEFDEVLTINADRVLSVDGSV